MHKRDFAIDIGLLRLAAIAVIIGALGVVIASVLLNLIHWFTNLFFFHILSFAATSPAHHHLGLGAVVVPVIGGLIVGVMARFGSEKIRGHGIPEAMEAILFGGSRMQARVAVLKPLSSAIVIGSGGPFGAEGPIIMTGSAVGSLISQHFKLTAAERKALLVAGAAAGMTGIFGTPVAAVLLAVELLLFEWRPRSLIPVAVAAATTAFLRPLVFGDAPLFPIVTGTAHIAAWISCLVAGLLVGAAAAALSALLYKVEDRFHQLPLHWMWWPAMGGLVVGVGGYLEPRALGVGYDVIADLLNNRLALQTAAALLLVKSVIWVIALGSGTSGGVLAPVLMIGAGLGALLASWLPGADPALWPVVCMAAMLAATMGVPLTAVVFALELTHDIGALVPVLFASIVSFGLTVLLTRRSILTEKIARRGRHILREYGVDPMERTHVEEVMSHDVVTVPANLTLGQVAERYFNQAQAFRSYPVVTADGRLIGLMERTTLQSASEKYPADTPLADVLEPPPAVALPHETCRVVAARLAALGLERVAVVTDLQEYRLVGVVSRSDLVKTARHFFAEEQTRERFIRWFPRRRA